MIAFTPDDFECMTLEGLASRMAAIKARISPKLEELGEALVPWLDELTGRTFYVHVAKHARRTVNPPDDTWVALSEERRGYKMVPHVEVGLFASALFVRVGVIEEAKGKATFAEAAVRALKHLPAATEVFFDHQQAAAEPLESMENPAGRIRSALGRKRGELLLGRLVPSGEASGSDLVALSREVLHPLLPVYMQASPEKAEWPAR